MSMCEIVNRPEKFVSQAPHYVVNDLDWIQCRFLFVHVSPTEAALAKSFPRPPNRQPQGYIEQDPVRPLQGLGGHRVQIPRQRSPGAGPEGWVVSPQALTRKANTTAQRC